MPISLLNWNTMFSWSTAKRPFRNSRTLEVHGATARWLHEIQHAPSSACYTCFEALFCRVDGAFHDEYMTFNMPLPLPTGSVLVVSFPVEELFWKQELLTALYEDKMSRILYFKIEGENQAKPKRASSELRCGLYVLKCFVFRNPTKSSVIAISLLACYYLFDVYLSGLLI